MRTKALSLLTALTALAAFTALPLAAQSYSELGPGARRFVSVSDTLVALEHVKLVDGTGAEPMEDQTILISGGKFAGIGPSSSFKVPAGARRMDLAGHTVLPGLVGMHDHTFYTTPARGTQANFSSPLLYLASGVTTIRTTGSYSPYHEINLKRTVDAGRFPGPFMYVTGPYLTGETGNGSMHQVLTPEDARRVVSYWASEGVSWLKFYTTVSRDVLRAAVDEAHKHGVKVTGHLCSVSFTEAVAAGIDNLEHGLFVNTDYSENKQPDACPQGATATYDQLDLGSAEVQHTFKTMIENDVPMTSTLAVYELFVPNRPPVEPRTLEAMSPDVRTEYLQARVQIAQSAGFGLSPELFAKGQAFELAFVRAGGLLAAGVDPTGNGGALPGFGDQRNFELLHEAGFTPVEVVRIMSLNGAKVLGGDDEFGSVAAGKRADLVVIRGDPIARPADIRNVVTVFKEGVGYDSPAMIEAVRGQVGIR